jgi:hypothetical protein
LASGFEDVGEDNIGSLVQAFKGRFRREFGWGRLGGAYIFSLLIEVAFDGCDGLGQMLGNEFGSESGPGGNLASFDGSEEGRCGRSEADGMKECHKIGLRFVCNGAAGKGLSWSGSVERGSGGFGGTAGDGLLQGGSLWGEVSLAGAGS